MPVTKGFTLIELLIVSAIMALTLLVGLPAWQEFQHANRARQDIIHLKILLHSSREQAVHLAEKITLCPQNANRQCTNDWNLPLMVFNDRNNNQQLDPDETLLNQATAGHSNSLRHFSGQVISFDARGFAGFNTGSFSYCYQSAQIHSASFVISRLGRIRRGGDSNNDGIAELASGQNVPCPS
ncbi:prepilin-type N-terminal cleavage/methylation domain-containing protein [Venatoribacter cucullus]|uniref:Type II secretion system protein H n=1 Tax=Venatoribacter cucullus TaxID=2661630 RepID=A0A9X7YMW8_9GAMM|nr:GspH/FimT family pseudopilin [Venatoribacter cucullus]QQD20706.1 prepilin-type N-terminal cleavage/methylation domain-containing protein [Oceanospirillaceae bacterium ASx5O]QQD23413.1 prepilin-type N-terminal cleavage/methylation domain-containing protein [Venatoribacter cucullus]